LRAGGSLCPPAAYVAEWGGAASATRLKKISYSIAAFCRNAKRRKNASMIESIRAWENDLSWLKMHYYDGRFDCSFTWPSPRSD
jgi:hypothetical protein